MAIRSERFNSRSNWRNRCRPAHELNWKLRCFSAWATQHFALGAMSDSALAYEAAAARAAEAGLRKTQIEALARLAVPAWYLDPPRGNDICEQAVEGEQSPRRPAAPGTDAVGYRLFPPPL